jgi:NitT/TauT family transport system ATP-binding protein
MDAGTGVPMTARTTAVSVAAVGKTFRGRGSTVEALRDIDLQVPRGSFTTLFGPSGCGKSTLLRIIAGLLDADEGQVTVFGDSPREAARAKHIGWVPQRPALLPWLSVRGNAGLTRVLNRRAERTADPTRAPGDVAQMLAEVGLGEFADARPSELSGGMAQRASLARVFVQGAPLLLMDEPFSALDELTREVLQHRLLDVWSRHRKTVVFVTHSPREAVLLSDRILVMSPRPGRIVADIEVDLPRPRPADIATSTEFVGLVSRVRAELAAHWDEWDRQ